MSRIVTRRLLVLAAAIFWQGGFVFYGAVVVPIGRATIRPPELFAFVTQIVTLVQNGAGVFALAVLFWDLRASTDANPSRRRRRWRIWWFLLISLIALFLLHLPIDQRMDRATRTITDEGFRPWHIAYLWVATMQWAATVVYAVLMLDAWRAEDAGADQSKPEA